MEDSTADEEESKQQNCREKEWSIQIYRLEHTEDKSDKKEKKGKPPNAIPG